MSLTLSSFVEPALLGCFVPEMLQYMVCRLRSHRYFSPIITFHLSANGVTVLVRLLYLLILPDPDDGIRTSFCTKV
jgi:hypothetical protein